VTESNHEPADLVFLDTETTGLALDDDIWEFAAIRRDAETLRERSWNFFIEHDREKCKTLPESFRDQHNQRFTDHTAVSRKHAAWEIHRATSERRSGFSDPHIIGAVPNFDTERMSLLLRAFGFEPGWHYHLLDVENLAVGYLSGRERRVLLPSWDSDELSWNLGIKADEFERHTAMGDVLWARAIFDKVMSS